MQVETFECTETAAEPIEATEEAAALIEELGLTGQRELITKTDERPARRNPYRQIRADERFVYQTICPSETEMHEYKASPIPLRVLQIAAHAKSLAVFKNFWVWHQRDSVEKDPVLVATTGGRYTWERGDTYILARWGDELESFPVLLERACDKARKNIVQSVEKLLACAKSATDQEIIDKGAGYELQW